MATTNNNTEYVGLNPSEAAPPSPAPLPKSHLQTYIQIAVCLLSIRLIYSFSKALALLVSLIFLAIAAYQINTSSNQAIQNHDARFHSQMDRIDREREESEAMVAEAARMMLDINKRHLEEYLITHPDATYEQWIGNLHPENVVDAQTIDHRFYVEDSDHRILWNEMIGESERVHVPSRSLKNKDVEAGGN